MEQIAQKRQTAVKVRISDILSAPYIREEGWKPNYLQVSNGKKVSRINIIGTVITIPTQDVKQKSFVFDDGSGTIVVRSFDDTIVYDDIDVGDVIMLIGRPREFGTERYILPEVIKKIKNFSWIKVRKMELEKELPVQEAIKEEVVTTNNVTQDVCLFIKEKDGGDGVLIEDLASSFKNQDIDKILEKLIMQGEVFEVGNGKVKVLE
jgi:RPA family protein